MHYGIYCTAYVLSSSDLLSGSHFVEVLFNGLAVLDSSSASCVSHCWLGKNLGLVGWEHFQPQKKIAVFEV